MNDCFIGEIMLLPYSEDLEGWLPCDGRTLSALEHGMLFTIIGHAFGGEGKKFNLPNLIDRVAVGEGDGVKLGQSNKAGEGVQITLENLPKHQHDLGVRVANSPSTHKMAMFGDSMGIVGVQSGRAFETQLAYTQAEPDVTLDYSMISSSPVGRDSSYNQEVISIVQPVLGLQFMICVNGVYPSRPS